jgi:phosphatidylglycerol:prolipoprotein diacylglycerol transferase
MAPTLQIFGLAVQSYPLAVLLAAGGGLWLVVRAARVLEIDDDRLYDLGFYALLGTGLGARLTYVLTHLRAYADAPLSVLSLTPTALWWPGGLVVGVLVVAIYWRKHPLPLALTLDAAAVGLSLALAIERLGAFLGGQGLGQATTMPWGVTLWEQVRHPVQVYEALALLAVLGVLWRQLPRRRYDGQIALLFVLLYGGSRLFVEAYRAQPQLILDGIRAVQVIAFFATLGSLAALYARRFSGKDVQEPSSPPPGEIAPASRSRAEWTEGEIAEPQ